MYKGEANSPTNSPTPPAPARPGQAESVSFANTDSSVPSTAVPNAIAIAAIIYDR